MKPSSKVLIIDDDEIYSFVLARLLRKNAFVEHVACVHSASAGLDYLKNHNHPLGEDLPDLIFLDINMPIMNGWDFLEEYKALRPTLHKDMVLYMLSSSVFDADILRSQDYTDVAGYVAKPITNEKFLHIVHNHFILMH